MEQYAILYGRENLFFNVQRSNRKTLEISVEPDTSIVITAPYEVDVETIKQKVCKRAFWIKQQQAYFSKFLPRTPERHFIPGETHLYLGQPYRLKSKLCIQSRVELSREYITIYSHYPTRSTALKQHLNQWYYQQALTVFNQRVDSVLTKFSDYQYFKPDSVVVKKMNKRWGSMSSSGKLILNLQLVKAPLDCLDYVIAHELCHLKEFNHGPKFYALLESLMPDWLDRKHKLELVLS